MVLKEFRAHFTTQLTTLYPKTEVDTFFFLLVEEYLGFQRVNTVLKPDFKVPDDKMILLENALKRLQKEEPVQYILGKTEFYGLPFSVNKHTLIPRPETEELVEWILSKVDTTQALNILDIGTGTGCIPISLAKHLPNAKISTIDVSNKALQVAKENAILNNVDIHFMEVDILQAGNLPIQYDIIVSNPPYVRELEKVEIKNNVLENEPHLALFVDDNNPLLFYNKIADLAKKHLSEKGVLFFEINQYLGKETIEMLSQKGFSNIELRRDLFSNDRMVKSSINT